MSTSKLTRRENLTKYAFWLGPVGPTEKENEVKMYKKYYFLDIRHHLFGNCKDPDPYQIEKQDADPDQYKSEKQDPDPYQKGLDP
jgi:hypothetical protein